LVSLVVAALSPSDGNSKIRVEQASTRSLPPASSALQFNSGWLGGAVVRASDLWSTGCEFDSRPCTAGLVLGWVTDCGRVNHLRMELVT